jgi:hypothetical protein
MLQVRDSGCRGEVNWVRFIPQEPEHDIEVVLGRPALRLDGVEGRCDIGPSPEQPACRACLDGDDRK